MTTRADVVRVAYPLFQAGGGGSTPTSALDFFVDRITKEKFVELNQLWHSRLPKCTNAWEGFAYGAIFDETIYAVAWWSKPVNAQLANGKTLELRRMAIGPGAPKNTASRFLAVMVKLIRTSHLEVGRLISYQDTEVHTGTIYKASGWAPVALSRGHSWTYGDGKKRKSRNPEQSLADKVRWEKLLVDRGEGDPR